MRIMLWGGRSKARILIDMISEIYPAKAEIIGIFDETLDELSFDTKIKLYSDETGLSSPTLLLLISLFASVVTMDLLDLKSQKN